MHHPLRSAAFVLLTLLLAACGGLGGEPRIVATLPPPTPAPTEVGYPIEAPNLVRGAAIYAENCTRCHGITGAGDGELVLSGEVTNVASFLDPATMIDQYPTDWHTTITDGRIDNLMPPWREALTEQERWDVAYYTYTLHYTAEQLEQGRILFIDNCADCHGDEGLGDGIRADELGGSVRNLQDHAAMSTLSDQVMFNTINEGIGDGMPAFGDELTPDQIRAAAAYARTLGFTGVEVFEPREIAAAQTDEPVAPAATAEPEVLIAGTVSGHITQGTAGGSALPIGVLVTLFIFPSGDVPQQVTTTSLEDGTFSFSDIPLDPSAQYVATVLYRARIFASELITPEAGAQALEMPITIYELTEDPAVIEIVGMVTQVSLIGENLEIVQVFSVRNTSDRAFSTSQLASNGNPISLVFSLPPGALIVGFNDESRYVAMQDESLVIDTAPVIPGAEHIVQVVYIIPYSGGAIVEQRMNYAFNGEARLLVYPIDTRIESDQFALIGEQQLGQTIYQAYGEALTLQPGETIRYDVAGGALDSGARSGNLVDANFLPIVIILVVIGEIVLIGFLYLRHRQRRAAAPSDLMGKPKRSGSAVNRELIDDLIRQIAELDAAYQQGEIPEERYQEQRAELKARLSELMTP